jgi:hypothetical protein
MSIFFDTSVLVAGLIDFGPQSAPAQRLLHAVAEKKLTSPATAWHCCLEFFSVATRLPAEYRLSPGPPALKWWSPIIAAIFCRHCATACASKHRQSFWRGS